MRRASRFPLELCKYGREAWVFRLKGSASTRTAFRNSGVIRSGSCYLRDDRKSELCPTGWELLCRYYGERDVGVRTSSKVLVAANEDERANVERIHAHAHACDVSDVMGLDRRDLHALEPDVSCVAARYYPSTGIFEGGSFRAGLEDASLKKALKRVLFVNIKFGKGKYFAYFGRPSFEHLVYPISERGGLGVHTTLDMNGRFHFDADWSNSTSDVTDESRRSALFCGAICQYWTGLPNDGRNPIYICTKPRGQLKRVAFADFPIEGDEDHMIAGLVSLKRFPIELTNSIDNKSLSFQNIRVYSYRQSLSSFLKQAPMGIDSLAPTCSLTIAREVRERIQGA